MSGRYTEILLERIIHLLEQQNALLDRREHEPDEEETEELPTIDDVEAEEPEVPKPSIRRTE